MCNNCGNLIILIIFSVLYIANDSLSHILMGFNAYDYYLNNIWIILLGQIVVAILLALISSCIAITKYLEIILFGGRLMVGR